MKNSIAVLAAVAAFASCVAQAEEATEPKLARGLLMKQGGKLVFAPCRDRSYAVMEDVSPHAGVTAALDRIGLEAGKKLYVEVFAVLDGLALKASGLNFAQPDGRCQPPGGKEEAWQAAGAGWALAAGGDRVVLKRQGRADLAVPYGPFRAEGALASYEASQGANKLALRFEPAVCEDKAAGVLLGWRATVTANGEVLKGCAWQR
ncbi:MAG: putative rane protein [Rhodocyclaceae bacterium]|nr:putative rane protein [Rhodocyclaceae bacterium]